MSSLIDDAQQLLKPGLHEEPSVPDPGGRVFLLCGGLFNRHADDCPWPRRGRILAALEAAERVAAQNGRLSDGRIGPCPVCGGGAMAGHPIFTQDHRTNCSMKALIMALRGEVPA